MGKREYIMEKLDCLQEERFFSLDSKASIASRQLMEVISILRMLAAELPIEKQGELRGEVLSRVT